MKPEAQRGPQSETKPFIGHYYHDGARWGLTVHAYDWADAEARFKKLGAVLDGELVVRIPGRFGFAAYVGCALRNWIARIT